jgi:hypothetical protein
LRVSGPEEENSEEELLQKIVRAFINILLK